MNSICLVGHTAIGALPSFALGQHGPQGVSSVTDSTSLAGYFAEGLICSVSIAHCVGFGRSVGSIAAHNADQESKSRGSKRAHSSSEEPHAKWSSMGRI